MIERKPKICKGTGKAKGHGCGDKKLMHRYGLCKDCFATWLYGTPQGLDTLRRNTLKAKEDVKKDTERRYKQKRKIEKESILKKSYFETQLQTEINTIVRLIDNDMGCISCGHGWETPWKRQAHAGHYHSVGSDPTLRFNLQNIYKQCSICNNWKSANLLEYNKGIIAVYGEDHLEVIQTLQARHKELHLSREDLKELVLKARKIKKDILAGKTYSREQINHILNIYI